MSKVSVAGKRRPEKPAVAAPQTVPLKDITITFTTHPRFTAQKPKEIRVTGEILAFVLAWLQRIAPGRLCNDTAWDSLDSGLLMEGLTQVMSGLSETDDPGGLDFGALMFFLEYSTQNIAGLAVAENEGRGLLEGAVVTIDRSASAVDKKAVA